MPVLIDGNNLLHTLKREDRSRQALRRRLLDLVRHEKVRVCVIFDGPPPQGAPHKEELGRLTIRYAGASKADDLIVAALPEGAQARSWTVVTNDRGLQRRARECHAQVQSLHQWQSRAQARPRARSRSEPRLSAQEIAAWERYFSQGPQGDGEPE